MVSLALYQPDIPQNTGAAIRLCACLGIDLNIIEPCGFLWDDRKIKQSAMDYIDLLTVSRHPSWDNFYKGCYGKKRIILMTTKAATPYTDFEFSDNDILLAGRESAGVPEDVHQNADARVIIPMPKQARSLNVINSCAMILGEALRQTKGFAQ